MSDYRVNFTDHARDDLIRLGLNRQNFSRQISRELPDPYGGMSVRNPSGGSNDDRSAIIGGYAISYQVTNAGMLKIMTVTRVR